MTKICGRQNLLPQARRVKALDPVLREALEVGFVPSPFISTFSISSVDIARGVRGARLTSDAGKLFLICESFRTRFWILSQASVNVARDDASGIGQQLILKKGDPGSQGGVVACGKNLHWFTIFDENAIESGNCFPCCS